METEEQQQGGLPSLDFYCRSARVSLKKAGLCRRSQLLFDELSQLRKFETLVASSIPSHPLYNERRTEPQFAELQEYLADCRSRISEIEHELELRGSSRACSETGHSRNNKGKAPSPSITSRSPSISPKKQQTWGIWTANPQHESTQGNPAALLSFGSLSPPRKHRNSRAKRSEAEATGGSNLEPIVLPRPPLSSRSCLSDRRLQDVLEHRGAPLPANQLNSFGADSRKNEPTGHKPADPSQVLEFKRHAAFANHRKALDWNPVQSQVEPKGCFNVDNSHKSSANGGRRFRYAPDFFEKRLQDRMKRIQRHCMEANKGSSASSPEKGRTSSNKLIEEVCQEEQSSEEREDEGGKEEGAADARSPSSALDMLAKHLNTGLNPSSITTRLQHMSMTGPEDKTQRVSSTGINWAKKLVPAVEQKLAHELKAATQTSRKKHRKKGILEVMDHVIRQAVDSDSPLGSGCESGLAGSSRKGLERQIVRSEKRRGRASEGLQGEPELEAKICSLQSLIGELRSCIESFTTRVEEEGERWQCQMQELEKEWNIWREDAEHELMGMKESLKDEMQMMMGKEKSQRGCEICRTMEASPINLEDSAIQKLEAGPMNLEFVQKEVAFLFSDMKAGLLLELRDTVTHGFKTDLAALELELFKEIESMKRQLEGSLPQNDETCNKLGREQVEELIDEKLERSLCQRPEIVSGGKGKVLADMKTELRLLWAEVDLLSKGREEIKENVEQLAQIAETAKENIGKEQGLLKSEHGSLKKQLQCFRKENLQIKVDTEDMKKEMELEMEEIRVSMSKLKEEGEGMKKLIDKLMESDANEKIMKGSSKDKNREGVAERMLIMDKVESLSHLYLGGLEEVRGELLGWKQNCELRMDEFEVHCEEVMKRQQNCDVRMDEIEGQCAELMKMQHQQESDGAGSILSGLPLRDLVLDGLESRVSHLESKLELSPHLEEARLRNLTMMEKEREQTASTLADVLAAAQKADQLLSEMVGAFDNMMRENQNAQQHLASGVEAAEAAVYDVKRISEAMDKEKKIAMVVLSEAKAKSLNIQEGIERDIKDLKGSIVLEKEAAVAAAVEAAAAAAKAEEAFAEICKTQRDSLSLSEDIAEAAGQAQINYSQELEKLMEEWRKSMMDEVSKARSAIEALEEEKRRLSSSSLMPEERSTMASDEKPVLQNDFDRHIKSTEDALADLAMTVKEMSVSLDSQSAMSKKIIESEAQDVIIKQEVKELREKMEKVLTKLDQVSTCSSKSDSNVASLHIVQSVTEDKIDDNLRQELENRMKETAAEQVSITDKLNECCKKVRKLETTQMGMVRSIEEVQSSTGDLEKSAAMWLQKYDAAGRLLQELEKRIATLETGIVTSGDDGPTDERLDHIEKGDNITTAQRKKLLTLYHELSSFLQRMRSHDSSQDDSHCLSDGAGWTPLDARLVSLANRIEQVESETFSNLRILDSKLEDFSVGVQTALEGASMAESKCSALGGELVKVFRMLANREESPSRLTMMDRTTPEELNNEQQQHQLYQHLQQQQQPHQQVQEHHHQQQHHARSGSKARGLKGKTQSPSGTCNFCKKATLKGEIADSNVELKHREMSHNIQSHRATPDAYTSAPGDGPKSNQSIDIEERSPINVERNFKENPVHSRSPFDLNMASKQDPQNYDFHIRSQGGRDASPSLKVANKPLQKDKNEEQGMGKRTKSELTLVEAKLPITQERFESRRIDIGNKKEECKLMIDMKDPTRLDCQLTNIRLEAGKVHVNDRHRPSPPRVASVRLIKREEAISVHP